LKGRERASKCLVALTVVKYCQKFGSHSQMAKVNWVRWLMPVIPPIWEVEVRICGWPRTGGVAQVAECLPGKCECEALCSNPSTAKKRKKRGNT
jgi:hypothetical protein